MNWETLLSGAVGAGIVTIIVKLLDIYSARNKTKSETVVNIAASAQKIAEGGGAAVDAVKDLLTIYDQRDDEHREEIAVLKQDAVARDAAREERTKLIQKLEADLREAQKEIKKLIRHRNEREARITALEQSNADLLKKIGEDTAETRQLRDKVETLSMQVADWEARYSALEKKYTDTKQAMVKIFEANPNLNIPPGLDMLLGDSIQGWKWPKRE